MFTSLSAKNNDFFEQVYAIVRLIPEGRVTSYGAIAAYLGSKKSSRMVGWAMNASHPLIDVPAHPLIDARAHRLMDVPAHRVVNRVGALTGKMHFSSPNRMQELLEAENIGIENDQIVDFKIHFWDPNLELM